MLPYCLNLFRVYNDYMEKFTPQPKLFVLKFNEYLKSIEERPISEAKLLNFAEENHNQFLKLQAALANDRISRQIKEFITLGLTEELMFETDQHPDPYSDDFYYSNLEQGYRVQAIPIYDDNYQIGKEHLYTRSPIHVLPEKQKLATEINTKYEEEDNYSFRREQEAKAHLLDQKVAAGEMVFIGEMKFDDYINLLKKSQTMGLSGKNFELVPCFEGNNSWWSENRKVYAYK